MGVLGDVYGLMVQEYFPHLYPTVFRLDFSAGAVENQVAKERLPLTALADR